MAIQPSQKRGRKPRFSRSGRDAAAWMPHLTCTRRQTVQTARQVCVNRPANALVYAKSSFFVVPCLRANAALDREIPPSKYSERTI
jgi:hypothetical protein